MDNGLTHVIANGRYEPLTASNPRVEKVNIGVVEARANSYPKKCNAIADDLLKINT